MKKHSTGLLEIHFAVFLFGLAGLFGELPLPASVIVFGRVLFASLTLGLIILFTKQSFRLRSKKDYLVMLLLGGILAAHWLAFFQAIQVSSVAVGLLTFSTFPVFTTFIEPFVFKERLRKSDIFISFLALLGVAIIVPDFSLSSTTAQGALWGIFSGLSFAVLSILNRKYVKSHASMTLTFYQEAIAAVILLPFVLGSHIAIGTYNLLMLVLLGVIFTALSHTLFVRGLLHVKAQRASVIATLEPVYGIVFAFLLLSQKPDARTLIGGAIILVAALIASSAHLLPNKTRSQT